MNKKSATTIAGGLVIALLAGIAALSISLGSTGTATATAKPQKPIVRTVTRTVTIHKKAPKSASGPAIVRVVQAPTYSASSMSAGYGDDQYESGYDGESEGGGGGGAQFGGGGDD